jgi:C4-type Zn-finger protein
VRTINNVFCRYFDANDGPAMNPDFEDIYHGVNVSGLVDAVKSELQTLMYRLNGTHVERESRFKSIVHACEGGGHTEITIVLEEVSGLSTLCYEEIF